MPAPSTRSAKALVDALSALPRPAGSEAERAARALCAARLRAAGFTVREERFAYSALAGRWATPAAGVASGAALLAASALGARGRPRAAAAVLAGGAAALGAWAWWSARRAVLDAPALRRTGTNLVATRGDAWPAVWLAAHLDSKRQPVSILVRAAGVTASVGAWLAGGGLAALAVSRAERTPAPWWRAVGAAGALGAVPIACSVVLDGSPGALDNASGSAAVVLAAEAAPGDLSLGIVLTSAEELGLAGARAWVRAHAGARAAAVINCDGVDDGGATTVFYSGRRPARLLRAVERGGDAAGEPVRVRRLLPGVLADSVAFADGGHESVTLSRGGLGTLARIHTRRDRPERLGGRGIAHAARLLAAAAAAAEAGDGR